MNKSKIYLGILAFSLIFLILFLPLDLLEILSLEVVGEPPINGLSWYEGVLALGGPLSMRFLAILGIIILFLFLPLFFEFPNETIKQRIVQNSEILFFLSITIIFFIINFAIGYAWWDPSHPLGLGPLFLPSILSIIVLGFVPNIARKIFQISRKEFAASTANFRKISFMMICFAYGYGLISLIWHCCSFFEPKMFFFFFILKFIQLWGMTCFFFKYGFPLFLNKFPRRWAFVFISLLFGFCYPWHTFGFAITFTFFGLLLCYLTEKTNSYLSGLILLYFAYIFHAGLA
ncbi:MAG: hypothetical protein ACTSRS_12275 [Candidatus Helarchaeota archaeon]